MKGRDILRRLQPVTPGAVALYQAPYADPMDVEEICDVVLEPDIRIREQHRSADGDVSDVHQPASGGLLISWNLNEDE